MGHGLPHQPGHAFPVARRVPTAGWSRAGDSTGCHCQAAESLPPQGNPRKKQSVPCQVEVDDAALVARQDYGKAVARLRRDLAPVERAVEKMPYGAAVVAAGEEGVDRGDLGDGPLERGGAAGEKKGEGGEEEAEEGYGRENGKRPTGK